VFFLMFLIFFGPEASRFKGVRSCPGASRNGQKKARKFAASGQVEVKGRGVLIFFFYRLVNFNPIYFTDEIMQKHVCDAIR
jgi:hypothetical protein